MPPRKTLAEDWSVRITPTDQKTIPKEEFLESGLKDAELLIVCEEGTPNGSPQLHYHIYLKTKYGRSSLERMCAKIGRTTNEVKGNAVFSIKQANTGTIGYVVKDRNVITSIGYDQHTLNEYFQVSAQYKRDLEASRRKDSRKRESSYKEIFENLIVSKETDPNDIITEVLDECVKRHMNFPSRSLMETNIFKVLYPHRPEFVRSFYRKNFEVRY